MAVTLTESQLDAVVIIERTCSILSLLGCLFIIVTFCFSKSFHRPINRLVFYASFGNAMTNVATLISRSYLDRLNSAGCQFQGFLVQMFMPADALWTLAMAVNVYLTFYHKFDAERLRKMEIPYLCVCYGVPFIPAFIYIFVRSSQGARVYGNALLWCWVDDAWDIWRIATFYGPVWLVIVATFAIYIRAGRTIYVKRKQLFEISIEESTLHSMTREGTVKTTEVTVTTEALDPSGDIQMHRMSRQGSNMKLMQPPHGQAYSITISSDHQPPVLPEPDRATPYSGPRFSEMPPPKDGNGNDNRAQRIARRRNQELNNAAWSYTKCAILFFTALLITWVPSSANRVYSVIHPGEISATLELMSALVLPLQGFWNAGIYILTSRAACKALLQDILSSRRPEKKGVPHRFGTSHVQHLPSSASQHPFRGTPRSGKTYETESMTELANSRGSSAEEQRSP